MHIHQKYALSIKKSQKNHPLTRVVGWNAHFILSYFLTYRVRFPYSASIRKLLSVTETAAPPMCRVQLQAHRPSNPAHLVDNHLSDTVASLHNERFRAMINDDYPYFTTVIGVNSAWGIDQGDAVLECKTAPGPDLGLISFRQLNGNAGGNHRSLTGQQSHLIGYRGMDIHACRVFGHVARKGNIIITRKSLNGNIDLFCHTLYPDKTSIQKSGARIQKRSGIDLLAPDF